MTTRAFGIVALALASLAASAAPVGAEELKVQLIQCVKQCSHFATDTTDELYIVVGGAVVGKDGKVKSVIAKRLPGDDNYYQYTAGQVNRLKGVDDKDVPPPVIWSGTLADGDVIIASCVFADQDNKDIKILLSELGKLGKLIPDLPLGNQANFAKKVTEELAKVTKGDHLLGGVEFVATQSGGKFTLTETGFTHGTKTANPGGALAFKLKEMKGSDVNHEYNMIIGLSK